MAADTLQIWDRVLTQDEILELANCESRPQGNVLGWTEARNRWNLSRIEAKPLLKSPCVADLNEGNPFLVVFPERRTIEAALEVCHVHGGRIPVPRNERQNHAMAFTGKQYEPVCSEDGKENLNQPYIWLGIEDPEGSGRWRNRYTHEQLSYAFWDENEGEEGDTCARMQGNGKA